MKLVLDTTYFLFIFGLNPEIIPRECLKVLESNSNKLFISDMVIFELNAKISKFHPICAENDMKTKAILEDTNYKVILSSNILIWNMSCFLRKYHQDYIDCVHWATAIDKKVDYFVTEDKKLLKLFNHEEFVDKFNNHFSKLLVPVINYKSFLKNHVLN